MSGKLKLHLAVEDKALYPKLLACNDTKIKEMAASFQKEMGSIKGVVDEYAKKWNAQSIKGSPAEFVKESKKLFDALGTRIKKENDELYTAFDKFGA